MTKSSVHSAYADPKGKRLAYLAPIEECSRNIYLSILTTLTLHYFFLELPATSPFSYHDFDFLITPSKFSITLRTQ